MSSTGWFTIDGCDVWEERRGEEYYLKFKIDETKDFTPEDVLMLGNVLLAWVDHIKGEDWIDSRETVFEINKMPYVREKKAA